jgi:translation initiation factor IF-2
MTQGVNYVNLCYTAHYLFISTPTPALLRVKIMKKTKTNKENIAKRPPIVVVMGHIDHGKSTLLDYIRKSNVTDKEAGGITQHLSAYVVPHTTKDGAKETITFLDTPGHEAFQKMRNRGAEVADIAILMVSAEDGVKPQTMEAMAAIKQANIPYIVAINKIDKPGADITRTKSSLIENEIYVEGMGGDIPWVGISAKTGAGISDLLDLIILSADLSELTGDTTSIATGKIIEGRLDPKRGNTATLMITNGTLKKGDFVVAGTAFAPVRIMEDAQGKAINEASLSTPVLIVGFSAVPAIGSLFTTVHSKKEAEVMIIQNQPIPPEETQRVMPTMPIIPILIKADVLGTIEAIEHELSKFTSDRIVVRVIATGVGDITSNDIQNVSATKDAIVVGFNVKVERQAQDLAERLKVEIDTFDIIYELSDWLNTALKNRTPRKEEIKVTGKAKVLKYFSSQKYLHVLGARAEEGTIKLGQKVTITRRDIEIGKGTIKNLQQYKSDVERVTEGEFGLQIETKSEVAPGDYLEPYDTVIT